MARQRNNANRSYIPVEDVNEEDIHCLGFNLMPFVIPNTHKYGNCRPVTEFEMIRTIAEGEFGTVYRVKDTKNSEEYALKKLGVADPDNPKVLPEKFLRQINNLKVIRHLNIVNLKEVVAGEDMESNYLLLDLCEYSLEKVIDNVDPLFFQQFTIKNIMKQLLAGLHFIHRFNVVHRSQAPKNRMTSESQRNSRKFSFFSPFFTRSGVEETTHCFLPLVKFRQVVHPVVYRPASFTDTPVKKRNTKTEIFKRLVFVYCVFCVYRIMPFLCKFSFT